MSKEAKIGLGIILGLLIVLGGVVTWKLRSGSNVNTAQANAESKEKSSREGEFKAGKAEAGADDFKSRHPHEGRETPKTLSPAPAGHFSKRDNERDLWNVASDSRRPREAAGEAAAIPSPQSMMPDPPNPESVDPNDRYGFDRQPASAPSVDPMGPPGEAGAASASGGRHRGDMFGDRSAEDYRLRDKALAEMAGPRDGIEPAPAPNAYRGENRNIGSPRPGLNYPDNVRDGPVPYDRGPSASFAGHQRHRSGMDGYGGLKDPGYAAKTGVRGDGTYDVQPNENFSIISKKLYGTESYFKALEELNRGKSPDGQLKVGQNILAPEDASELVKKYPTLCPKESHREAQQNHNATLVSARNLRGTRSYTVVEGDTLFDIARYELGKASRWAEIYELNSDKLGKDFDYLIPGTELALPEDNPSRPDPVTRRPDGGRQR